MQILNDAADQKIIGEAAYSLLIRREKINIHTLAEELARMAQQDTDCARQQLISEARHWLMTCRLSTDSDNRRYSPLRNLSRQDDGMALHARLSSDSDD